jgi:hypothetical protein
MALAMAARLAREESTREARIDQAFQLAFARSPTGKNCGDARAWRAMTNAMPGGAPAEARQPITTPSPAN